MPLFAFLFREDLHHKTLTKLLTIVVNCVLLLLLLSGCCCCLRLALRQGQGLLYFITALLCCALARHIWLLFKCFCCCHRVKDLPTLFFSSLYSSFISPLPSLLLSSNSSPHFGDSFVCFDATVGVEFAESACLFGFPFNRIK